jgi:hypothetical protein
MGSSSWRSCVSGRAIPQGLLTIMIFPDNRTYTGTYEDYGRISGIDIYVLVGLVYDIEKARKITNCRNGSVDERELLDDLRTFALRTDTTGGPNRGGCGLKLVRANEYRKGMQYDMLPTSYPCLEQGCVSKFDRSIDPRFSGKERVLTYEETKTFVSEHPAFEFELQPFGYTNQWGHNSCMLWQDENNDDAQRVSVRVVDMVEVRSLKQYISQHNRFQQKL